MDTSGPILVIVSGLSGSGKSVALKTFEDLDYYCADNLPVGLLPAFVRGLVGEDGLPARMAVGIDVRSRNSDLGQLAQWRATAEALGVDARLLYFEASDEVLLRRFADTRRRHPLTRLGLSLPEALARERALTLPLRSEADAVIDTSDLNVHQLRDRVTELFADDEQATGMQVRVLSVGFKHGLPLDVDMVLDCRFLPNPHWVEDLRPLTGTDAAVREFVLGQSLAEGFLAGLDGLLDVLLPAFKAEGKAYLTVAFGCTGGRHRSVAITEEVARRLRDRGLHPGVSHRDVGKAG